MTRVAFDVPLMLRGSGRLEAVAKDLSGVADDIGGLSFGGVPPAVMAFAGPALRGAQADLAAASSTATAQGNVLKTKAARALGIDTDISDPFGVLHGWNASGGGSGKGHDFLKGLSAGMSYLGMLETMRLEGRKWLTEAKTGLRQSARKLKSAERFYRRNPWVRSVYASPKEFRAALRNPATTLRRDIQQLNRRTRALDALDLNRRLPPALRNTALAKRVPLLGTGLGVASDLAGGRSVPDTAGHVATTGVGGEIGAGFGALVCGVATGATDGAAAPSCPWLVGAGSVGGGYAADKLYDPVVKPGVKLVVKGLANTGKTVLDTFTHPRFPGRG